MIEPDVGEYSQVASLGAVLKTSRENKKLTLEEVALRVNIPLKHLKSLENEAYDQLPGMPFAKGYLRSYAKVLGLNADALIAQFVDEAASQADSRVASINKVGQQVHVGHPIMRISLIFFVVALLGVSFWWWQTQTSVNISELTQPANPTVEKSEADLQLDSKNTMADPTDIQARLAAKREETASLERAFSELNAVVDSENPESLLSTENEPSSEDEPVYLSEEEAAQLANELSSSTSEENLPIENQRTDLQALTAVDSSEVAVTQGLLEMEFSGDCWVSIRDASDKLVFANTKHAGEKLSLSLDLPASVLIGKVSAVGQAVFDGKVLDLAAEAKKDVAKFTLTIN